MNVEILFFAVFLIVWFFIGFVTFLIEVKRSNRYLKFDDCAKHDLILFTGLGLLSLIVEIIVAFKEWFENWMDNFLRFH